jgi:type II secretion system protein H
MNPHARRAFTLIELLVVVTLLGLAAALVTLRLGGSTDQAQLRAATVEIEQALRLARHRARTRHQPVWLLFRPGTGHYRIVLRPTQDVAHARWRTLDGVTITRIAACDLVDRVGSTGNAPLSRDGVFALRVTPTGAMLPWALEIRAAAARRVLWTDGVTGRMSHEDGVGLEAYRREADETYP